MGDGEMRGARETDFKEVREKVEHGRVEGETVCYLGGGSLGDRLCVLYMKRRGMAALGPSRLVFF